MTANEIESIRRFLYPLGILPLVAFTARFLIQWWYSEKEGKTVVPKIFWNISILGNILFALHALIQLHFPIYFLQVQQTALAWRNLNLMQDRPSPRVWFFKLLFWVAVGTSFLFLSQKWIFPESSFLWIRSPRIESEHVPFWLHAIGSFSFAAFSFRFWLQWWEAETAKTSVLSPPFWLISIGGAILSGAYFILLMDWVNMIGPIFSLIPYTRNLFLSLKLRKKPTPFPCDIVLVAGETSGDLLGKEIADHFSLSLPHLRLAGIAGKAMRQAGVKAWDQAESFQVMGFFDVLKRFFFFYKSIKRLTKNILETNPKIVFFIDQPSLGLTVAKRLKKQGFSGKIIQVVAPSVWAYKKERVDAFAKAFHHIFPLFRFECAYFQDKMPTTWAGHPILETHRSQNITLPPQKKYLALFPGSRESEIRNNLKLELDAAKILLAQRTEIIPAIVLPDMVSEEIREHVRKEIFSLFPKSELFSFEDRFTLMQSSLAAITKSGTVTLELGLFKVPFACCYQTGFFTRLWLKTFCRLESSIFALPNIFLGKKALPEHILPPVSAEHIARDLEPYFMEKISFPEEMQEKILWNIDAGSPFGKRIVDTIEEILCEKK